MVVVRIAVATLALLGAALLGPARAKADADAVAPPPSGHYLFAWTGDADKQGNDFLAVIDADPASPGYGRLVATTATDQRTVRIHHTEYAMPASGMLFANDHDVGRTFIFDVNDPLHPRIAASFGDLDGYMHPHSFVRLPNGNVLATFQHDHRRLNSERRGRLGRSGGLVEIDDQGRAVRSASSADPALPDALLMPYGLVVLPGLDRVVSTNSSMHDEDLFSGVTYQVWRLSDLKLLQTSYLDVGADRYGHVSPEEPRLGPDGAVYVQTLACGVERITVSKNRASTSKLVHTFPGSLCGVPTIVGRYYIQSVPALHGLVVLDISDGMRPVEVARLRLSDTFEPHWTGWDPKTQRLVVTGSGSRLYLLKFDPQSGAIAVDDAFRDEQGRAGFDFAARDWPHGWTGTGKPHGVVFSR